MEQEWKSPRALAIQAPREEIECSEVRGDATDER